MVDALKDSHCFDNLKDTLFLIVHADTEQSNAYEDAQQKIRSIRTVVGDSS